MIRSPTVPSFCRLELPQPSYCPMKCIFCTNFYKCFILKIQAYAITSGFHEGSVTLDFCRRDSESFQISLDSRINSCDSCKPNKSAYHVIYSKQKITNLHSMLCFLNTEFWCDSLIPIVILRDS